jgi:transposase
MSRRPAAERFAISVSSAVRFVKEWRKSGATKAKRLSGDQRSRRIEEHHEAIMNAIEAKPDMTLVVIAEMPESEHGASFAPSSIWRFLDRHGVTFKKSAHPAEQDSRMWQRRAKLGANWRRDWIPTSWSSSMRPALGALRR